MHDTNGKGAGPSVDGWGTYPEWGRKETQRRVYRGRLSSQGLVGGFYPGGSEVGKGTK